MMSRLTAVCLFVLCTTATFGVARAQTPSTAPAAAEESSVEAAHRAFWSAYQKRDLWGVSQLWDVADENIAAAFPASSSFALGWRNIEESFRRSFSHNRDIRIDVRDLRTGRSGDLVWMVSAVRFEAVQTQTGQFVLMDRMLTTEVYRHVGGSWRLVHFHASYPGFRPQSEDPSTMVAVSVQTTQETESLMGVRDRFAAAFAQKNLGDMFELFSDGKDVASIHPTAPVPFFGPENVIASWRKTFEDIEAVTAEQIRTSILPSGETAVISELSQYHIAFKAKPEDIRHFHNVMTTFILRKESGQWKIAHYHAHLGFSFEDHGH